MKLSFKIILVSILLSSFLGLSQQNTAVYSFISQSGEGTILHHRIFIDNNYFIETVYSKSPSEFIKTSGGFYTKDNDNYSVDFEFNSNYEKDSIKQKPFAKMSNWKEISLSKLPLNGKWLMAGRVKETGEARRNLNRPRKTMKILINGYFQWIAFNTETFGFFGSGGGTYKVSNGEYTEQIEYFSRDNSKAGLELNFNYTLKGNDWYHKGLNSKGNPLHEIWTVRKN
jgi:hypothetical protein